MSPPAPDEVIRIARTLDPGGRLAATDTGASGPAAPGAPAERVGSPWAAVGPLGFVVILLVLATAYSGAFAVGRWAPPTLFALVLLLVALAFGGWRPIPERSLRLVMFGAWGWAGWAAASSLWADSPGGALEGAGRQLLYAAVLTIPIVLVSSTRGLRVAAAGVTVGICAIAVYTLAETIVDGPSVFLAGRLNDPVGYRNATALLFCLAYWPLLVVAAARERGRALRSCCLALGVILLGLAFLTQSRGVVVGLGCGGVVAFGLGPDRVRRAWLALVSVGALAVGSHWLLRPYHAFAGGEGTVTAHDIAVAGWALVAVGLASGALMALLAVFDNGLRPHTQLKGRARVLARAGLAVVVVAGVGGALAAVGDPAHEARVEWAQFTSLQTTSTSATRYTSAGGQRYDLWRIALDEFTANPVAGVGQGSYEFAYYELRRTNRNLDDPHGLLFQVAAELGLVGVLLFGLIPLGVAACLRGRWRFCEPSTRRLAVGLSAAGATFLGQSLVDWMFRIPGLTALGLLCLVLAAAIVARTADAGTVAPTPAIARPRRRSVRVAGCVGLVGATVLVLGLYMSDFYAGRARDEAGRSPSGELADARTAAALDPWSVRPHYLEASALESAGHRAAALAQLRAAERIQPADFVPLGLIGDWYVRGGDPADARLYYGRAHALNPLDSGLAELARTG